MIYLLEGQISLIEDDFTVVFANGIGYQVYISQITKSQLPQPGESTKLFTYHYIREDQQVLYGFSTQHERQFFILLTSISGIGPKVGIKLLSVMGPVQISQAIMRDDVLSLTSAPGIGKKVADRMIVELKDKVSQFFDVDTSSDTRDPSQHTNTLDEDLILALKTLGYRTDEIKKALHQSRHSITTDTSIEEGMKILLNHL